MRDDITRFMAAGSWVVKSLWNNRPVTAGTAILARSGTTSWTGAAGEVVIGLLLLWFAVEVRSLITVPPDQRPWWTALLRMPPKVWPVLWPTVVVFAVILIIGGASTLLS